MCLAIPAKVIALKGEHTASVSIGGIEKDISLALVDNVNIDDYVIIHVGFALNKLDAIEAEKTLQLLQKAGIAVE